MSLTATTCFTLQALAGVNAEDDGKQTCCDWQLQCVAVPCTVTTLDMFDKLHHAVEPILRPGSWIAVKCFEGKVDGIAVHDMLRELILNGDDSVNASTLTSLDQQQFVWRLFSHLTLGGTVNQYEDDVGKYREAVKQLYKRLVSCALCTLLVVYQSCMRNTCGRTSCIDCQGAVRQS